MSCSLIRQHASRWSVCERVFGWGEEPGELSIIGSPTIPLCDTLPCGLSMHCTFYSPPQCSKKHYWGSFLLCFVVLIVVYMRVCACESCISHGGLLTVGCRDRLPRLSSECFFECLPLPFSLSVSLFPPSLLRYQCLFLLYSPFIFSAWSGYV